MQKENPKNSKEIKIATIRTEEGLFLNKAYSFPLGFKQIPGEEKTLQVLSFFNKKCYLYDINRLGANFKRSIPFDVNFLTGRPKKDKIHFNQKSKKFTILNTGVLLQDRVEYFREENPSRVTYPPSYSELRFDSQLTKVESLRQIFDRNHLEVLKVRIGLESPEFWRFKSDEKDPNDKKLIFELLTSKIVSGRSKDAENQTDNYQPVLKSTFQLNVGRASRYTYINPAHNSPLLFVMKRGFESIIESSKSFLRLVGTCYGKVKFHFFDQRSKKVRKTVHLDVNKNLESFNTSRENSLLIRKGAIGYDYKNDRFVGYEPRKFIYVIGQASRGGNLEDGLTECHRGAKADKRFRELFQGVESFDEWFLQDQLKQLILDLRFGRGSVEVVRFDENTNLVIDGTSFRLIEKNELKELWSHQFKLALRPNFIKINKKVIASLTPDFQQIQLFKIEEGVIKVLKSIQVKDLKESLPKVVRKAELIHFEMPDTNKTKTQRPKSGKISLSYGSTIIEAELTKDLDAVKPKSITKTPYILAARTKNGEYHLLTKWESNSSTFKALDSELKVKVDKLKVETMKNYGNNVQILVAANHVFIKSTSASKFIHGKSQPRLTREGRLAEEMLQVSYKVYKGSIFKKKLKFEFKVEEDYLPRIVVSSLNENHGFLVHIGELEPQEYNFLFYGSSTTPKELKISRDKAGIRGELADLFCLNGFLNMIETYPGDDGDGNRLFWLLDIKKKAVSATKFQGGFEPFDFIEFSRSEFLDFDERNDLLVVMDFSSVIPRKGKVRGH